MPPPETKNPETCGRELRALSEKMGFVTEAELAEAANLDRATVSKLFNGKTRKPNFTTAIKLVEALAAKSGESPEDILGQMVAIYQGSKKEYSDEDIEFLKRCFLNCACPQPTDASRREDLTRMPEVPAFFGRREELNQLEQSIVGKRCRLVGLQGLGGIGKTALAVKLVEGVKEQFDYLLWRSLRNAPPLAELLAEILAKMALFLGEETELPDTVEKLLSQLMNYLHRSRCLLVLDEAEGIMQSGELAGNYREGYRNYRELFRRVGEERHQGCLLVVSQELPRDIAIADWARSLSLQGLPEEDAAQILGTRQELSDRDYWGQLIELYRGNPLALKIVSQIVVDSFKGRVAQYIIQNTLVLGQNLRNLLETQIDRLSDLEEEIMYWLAIARYPVSLPELQALLPVSKSEAIEAIDSLGRRSLLENTANSDRTHFALQPVAMKYITEELIQDICKEIASSYKTKTTDEFYRLGSLRLVSDTDQNLKKLQLRLILTPIRDKLGKRFKTESRLTAHLQHILTLLDKQPAREVGYSKNNIRCLLEVIKT
ncbi:MAG: XRE family transcriptional regulator [Oscillatoria sp. SIO1A7]|nr:XRE family transcriptional regulator [Oscillatoria sp. SIO1A7]